MPLHTYFSIRIMVVLRVTLMNESVNGTNIYTVSFGSSELEALF